MTFADDMDADLYMKMVVYNPRYAFSYFRCGVSWYDNHISLDCPECGGYALEVTSGDFFPGINYWDALGFSIFDFAMLFVS